MEKHGQPMHFNQLVEEVKKVQPEKKEEVMESPKITSKQEVKGKIGPAAKKLLQEKNLTTVKKISLKLLKIISLLSLKKPQKKWKLRAIQKECQCHDLEVS